MDSQQILNIVSKLGFSMLKNGAETYRIEDSLYRVLGAMGAQEIDVFVINSCIIISIGADDGSTVSKVKRCYEKVTDLYKIEKLNNLCRMICENRLEFEDIVPAIEKIERKKPYNKFVKLLGFIMVSVAFSVLFGGGVLEAVSAFIVTLAFFPVMQAMDALKVSLFFKNIIGSAVIAIVALLSESFLGDIQTEKAIIGAFMNLVPGISLTTSMRDLVAGDLIAGKNALTEAIIIAIGMALGSGLAIVAFRIIA